MSTTAPFASAQRILIGSSGAVAKGALRDQDGELATAAGAVTADFMTIDGAPVSSDVATTNTGVGTYTAPIPVALTATLGCFRVDWREGGTLRATTAHRVVGGFPFSLAELQAQRGLSTVQTAALTAAREWITNLIEHQTGAAWSPRFDAEAWTAGGGDSHVLTYTPVREVRSVTVNGTSWDWETAQSSQGMAIDETNGILSGSWFTGVCIAHYTHGTDDWPATLREAALVAAADLLTRQSSSVDLRTRSITNDIGVVQTLSYPGVGHPTGIDFVDQAILAYDQRDSGVA